MSRFVAGGLWAPQGLRGLGVRRQSHVVHVLPEASHGVSRVRECQADNVVTARATVASKAQNSGHASFGQSRRPVRRPRLKHSRTRWSFSEQADGEQALRASDGPLCVNRLDKRGSGPRPSRWLHLLLVVPRESKGRRLVKNTLRDCFLLELVWVKRAA